MKRWLLPLLITLQCHAQTTADGFAIPQRGRVFEFPRDHGSHPGFRTEWWYVTGHLDAKEGRRFGFQVTFFRQASSQADAPLFLAHSALLDVKGRRFLHQERLNREGWDAAASTQTLDVRNGNWSLRLDGDVLRLAATIHADVELKLTLKPAKPLVVFGENGVSRKGSAQSAASHYLTWPRLEAGGEVRVEDGTHEVSGLAWMDHEFSSSQLDERQVGWDWASLQLNDGTEIMVYRMRRADGSSDPAGTTLAWIDSAGKVRHIGSDAFTWRVTRTWTSPQSKAAYPIGVRLQAEDRVFELRPLLDAQEHDGAVSGLPYWEGACDVVDAGGGIIGRAFLELAGYAGDLAGHLRAGDKTTGEKQKAESNPPASAKQ
jgi:predicted secreted hydrolase